MQKSKIIYFPLEPYEERYTAQLSAPITGWFESKWIEYNIPYIRIDGTTSEEKLYPNVINKGAVLDTIGRTKWCANQILKFIDLYEKGFINPDDKIYLDDFFHPGIESLAYINHFAPPEKTIPRIYAYCWAQSVDKYDFTHSMNWMRNIEKAYGKIYHKVFVANTLLRELLHISEVMPESSIKVVGLPFNSEQVLSMMKDHLPLQEKKRQIVFSSRFSWEKRPGLFLDYAQMYRQMYPNDSLKFVICSSKKTTEWVSSNPYIIDPSPNLIIKTGLTKQEYYDTLCESEIQINTSLQDWVSYTLLEAVCANCQLIYPNERSFPETFLKINSSLNNVKIVDVKNIRQVCYLIHDMLRRDSSKFEERFKIHNFKLNNIVKTHDKAWMRIVAEMGLLPEKLIKEQLYPVYG